jgi:putative lipase involved disintegration of autophagic bodies
MFLLIFYCFFTWAFAQKMILKHVIHQQSQKFQYQRHSLGFSATKALKYQGTHIGIQNGQQILMLDNNILPDIQDPETILALALMSYNAYESPEPFIHSSKWNQVNILMHNG